MKQQCGACMGEQGQFSTPPPSWSLSHLGFSSMPLDRFLSSLEVTWKPSHLAKSQVTSIAELQIPWVTLSPLFVFCFYLNSYTWHYKICFTINIQKAFSILFNDKLHVRCHRLRQHCRLKKMCVGCYGAAFSDTTIVLKCDFTIVLMLMHGDINNASLREKYGVFQNKPSDLGPSDLWSHLRNQRQSFHK